MTLSKTKSIPEDEQLLDEKLREERQLRELASNFLAASLPHSVITTRQTLLPRIEVVKWTDFESIYKYLKEPIPQTIDTTTREPIELRQAGEKSACTLGAWSEIEECKKGSKKKSLELFWVRGYNEWNDEAIDWRETKED